MIIKNNINKKFHHNNTYDLTIKIVNVKGITDIVDYGTINYICKNRSLLNENEQLEKKNPHFKILCLLLFIIKNKNCIIILTETKLKNNKDVIFSFYKLIKKITNNSFWIFCNNQSKEKACGGVTTLIPKKLFKKPTHQIFAVGMVTSSKIELKKKPFTSLTLISYYNPDSKSNIDLSKNTIENFSHIDNLIIAGDFNEIIDYNRDFNRVINSSKSSTIKRKISNANKFENIIKNANLNYNIIDNTFTFFSKKLEKINFESRIDWIFYSNFFKKFEIDFKIEKDLIQSDHNILSLTFISSKNKTNQKKSFFNNIPDQIFKDKSFTNEIKKIIKKVKKKKIEESKKLEISIKKTFEHYKFFKKRKKMEKLKKLKKLKQKIITASNSSSENKNEICDEIEDEILKEINEKEWEKKLFFERIKGPNKGYTNYLKNKTQINNKITFLLDDDNKTKLTGINASNFAKEKMKLIYQNNGIDENGFQNICELFEVKT